MGKCGYLLSGKLEPLMFAATINSDKMIMSFSIIIPMRKIDILLFDIFVLM